MEIKARDHKAICIFTCWMAFLLSIAGPLIAQPPARIYTVKDNKMYIELGKPIGDQALDSFIAMYGLYELPLQQVIRGEGLDSLKSLGWKLQLNSDRALIISKSIASSDDIKNPAGKISVTEKYPTLAEMFPPVSAGVVLGYNRFQNKSPFAETGQLVTFFLRHAANAKKVMLAGSFNLWRPDALAMTRTDSGWVAQVQLSPGKYWYKFILDGEWSIDTDNLLRENDGRGNVNSVFYKTNTLFRLTGFADARKVFLSGSFNKWRAADLLMKRTPAGWELPLYLADGTHTYRFVVDGNWYTDPVNPGKLPNEFNDSNSVIRIGRAYAFHLDGFNDAKRVVLTGSFNNWRKEELFMVKSSTGWDLSYTLGPGNYEYHFIVDGKTVAKPAGGGPGNLYIIVDPNYTFRLRGHGKARTVFLAGDFNDWSPDTLLMQRLGEEWVLTCHLPPGKHLYKFIINGRWMLDPANKLWEQNEYNTGNSVIWIER